MVAINYAVKEALRKSFWSGFRWGCLAGAVGIIAAFFGMLR